MSSARRVAPHNEQTISYSPIRVLAVAPPCLTYLDQVWAQSARDNLRVAAPAFALCSVQNTVPGII